jgi:uncharacterized protein (DUF58 family)
LILLGVLAVFVALVVLQRVVYERFWQRGLSVEMDFSARSGVEGSSLDLTETITSRKALPLPWLTVKFQVSRHLGFEDSPHAAVTDDYYRQDLFSLGAYQRIRRTLRVELRKRGYYTIKSIDLLSSDLLLTHNLVSRSGSRSSLTVTPRPIPLEDVDIPYSRLLGAVLARTSLLPDPFEFRTIREYQDFDTLKSVNWLATARTGELKVNVHENTAAREVLVLLNVRPDREYDDDRPLEDGIRISASLCERLVADGVSVGLVSNARDIVTGEEVEIPPGQSLSHVSAVLEQLGRLDLSRRASDLAPLLESSSLDLARSPVLLLVSFNCSRRLSDAWDALLARGHQGLWIIPRYASRTDDRLPATTNDVLRWEVRS